MRGLAIVMVLASTIIMQGKPGQQLKCEITKAKHGTVTICLPPKHMRT